MPKNAVQEEPAPSGSPCGGCGLRWKRCKGDGGKLCPACRGDSRWCHVGQHAVESQLINRAGMCNPCAVRRNRENVHILTDLVQAYKLIIGCVDCGYRDHPEALDLDHVSGVKTEKVSRLVERKSIRLVLDEVAKCEVVCANCHRVRTARRRIDGD